MMTVTCFWLLAMAMFLEACHRAPLLEGLE